MDCVLPFVCCLLTLLSVLQGGVPEQVLQWIGLQAEPFLILLSDQCTSCYMTHQTVHINNSYAKHCTIASRPACSTTAHSTSE